MKTLRTFVAILILGFAISGQVGLIPENAKFSADARVEFTKDPSPAHRKNNNLPPFEPKPYSTGTMNGVPYLFFFEDGRGEIEGRKGNGVDLNIDSRDGKNWETRCSRSAKNTDKHCGVVKGELTIIKFVLVDGKSLFWITTLNTFEKTVGLPITITVDDGPAHLVSEIKGPVTNAVLNEIRTGKKVTVRYLAETPESNIEHIFDLHGFNEAMALCEWMIKKIE